MDKACIFGMTAPNIKDFGRIINFMGLVTTPGLMAADTLGFGKRTTCMDSAR